MNKPETKPDQSLEEILTSIRKALAEEEVQEVAESPSPAGSAPATDEQPAPAKGDPLSGQLAVALNGSGSRDTAPDDDLDDLLVPTPSKGASSAPVDPEPSEPASGESKDPLWFLARKPAAESEPAQKEEPLSRTSGDDATPAPEELKLTRLETLRSSLPPLFGADAEERAEIKAEPINFVQPASPRPATLADFGTPEKGKDEKPEAKAALPDKVPQPEKASAPPATRPELATPLPTPPPPSGVQHPPASVAPAAEAMASALAEPRRNAVKGSPAATAQARALEEMIGQLLEPVIRNWLEANLPRLVEKVVREEVARTAAAKSDPAKD
jgi:hypothetical protein